MSIAPNPLNDISRVYLEQIAESAVPGKPAEKVGALTNIDIPKSERDAARERLLAKAKAKRKKITESHFKVGDEVICKASGMEGEVVKVDPEEKGKYYTVKREDGKRVKYSPDELKLEDEDEKEEMKEAKNGGASKKAEAKFHKKLDTLVHKTFGERPEEMKEAKKGKVRRWWDDDGDGIGYEKGEVSGKFKRKKKMKESFSNWRQDLSEVMGDELDTKKIKEKKVKNKIKINPDFKEAVEEIGGTLLEMVEIDEIDYIIEDVYSELQGEGYEDDDIEEALEYALTEAKVTFGHDTESPRDKMMKQAKSRLRFLGRKVGEKLGAAKKAATYKASQAQVAAYNKGREAMQTASDKTRKARQAVADAPGKAKKGVKGFIKKQAEKVVKRMSEETVDEALRSREERMARMMTDKDRQKQKKERELKAKADEIISTERALSKGGKKKTEKTYDTPSAEVRKLKPGQKKDTLAMKARKAMEEYEIDEKMNLKTADMGDVIKDFQKSDAPQFKGKTKEERRQMAIAAKLTAERGGEKLGEQQEENVGSESKEKQMLAKKKQMLQKQYMLDKMRLQAQQQGKLPMNHREETALDRVRASIIAKHGKGMIYDPNAPKKPKTQKKPSNLKSTDMTKATDPRPGSRYRGD